MKHAFRLLLLLALLSASGARAAVAISFDAGEFFNADGTSPVPDGSLVLLITDTTGNGFGQLFPGSLNVGSFIDGFDDLILARASVDRFTTGTSSVSSLLPGTEFYNGWNAGDALALVWFSSLDSTATTLSAGTAYGYYSATSPQDDSDPWLTPSSGSISIKFLSSVNDGSYDDALFRTNLTVSAVPEPATYAALAGLAALGLAAWRRQKRQ